MSIATETIEYYMARVDELEADKVLVKQFFADALAEQIRLEARVRELARAFIDNYIGWPLAHSETHLQALYEQLAADHPAIVVDAGGLPDPVAGEWPDETGAEAPL